MLIVRAYEPTTLIPSYFYCPATANSKPECPLNGQIWMTDTTHVVWSHPNQYLQNRCGWHERHVEIATELRVQKKWIQLRVFFKLWSSSWRCICYKRDRKRGLNSTQISDPLASIPWKNAWTCIKTLLKSNISHHNTTVH